ncbi:hypothetical protein [Streptococcus dentiloxodontae]
MTIMIYAVIGFIILSVGFLLFGLSISSPVEGRATWLLSVLGLAFTAVTFYLLENGFWGILTYVLGLMLIGVGIPFKPSANRRGLLIFLGILCLVLGIALLLFYGYLVWKKAQVSS